MENIQTLLMSIDDANHNAEMIKTMQMGANALRNTMIDTGVTVEAVDDFQVDLKELLDDHEEIQQTISTPIAAGTNDNDADLEDEFNDLFMAEEKIKENAKKAKHDESLEQKLRMLSVDGLPSLNTSMRSEQLNVPEQNF